MSLKSLQALQDHKEYSEREFAPKRKGETKQQLAPWIYTTPLLAAPTLPLIRITLKDYPKARAYAFGGAVGFFLIHGFYLISTLNFGH